MKRPSAPIAQGSVRATPAHVALNSPGTSAADVRRATRQKRRALRGEIRKFTKDARRRRRIRIGIAGALLLLVVGSLAVAYGPLFSVKQITIIGTSNLDRGEVESALEAQRGVPLAFVDDKTVQASLAKFPLIESYSLEARPPHELVVRIVERTPIGVIESASGFTLVDAAGVVLSTSSQRPAGRPLIVTAGDAASPEFIAIGRAIRSLPEDFRARVDRVTATSAHDISFVLDSGLEAFWGSAEESALKSLVLTQTVAKLPNARHIDVSAPGAVVIS
jgi:cell division protein FtsQ